MENEKSALESQKEFLGNLKLKYENISESANVLILLDSLSSERPSGMILKIEDIQKVGESDLGVFAQARFRARGVAKPISLDPQEIIDKIQELSQELAKVRDELGLKTELVSGLAIKMAACEGDLRESELEYNNYKNQKDNIQEHHQKLQDELELVALETKETEADLSGLNEKESSLQENALKLKEQSQANQQAIERGLEEIASKNILKEKILVIITRMKAEIHACAEKISGLRETCKIYTEAQLKAQAASESLKGEEAASTLRIRELEESLKELGVEIDNALQQKASLEKESSAILSSLNQTKDNLKDLQNNITVRKDTLDGNRARIHELQMQQQELTYLQNGIYEKIFQVYRVDSQTLKDSFRPELNLEETTQEIDLLKQKIESYGQVNLVAIEEFEELKQRFDFLNAQAQDLIKSKESLHEAILKINRTTKKMFLETFEKLAIEFKNYFRMLFGGGDAQLFLIDEQDVLESGIEIVCRPPGKRLQNVLLLSGGEKAMSAIALLFAIFKVKPSPFCVLDEIDAALDEANVDRFSRMLVEFSSQSQFIMITHNKKTIAHSNIMYGITMEKAGISKIISVKLAENRQNPVGRQAGQEVLEPA